jgi:hypothetical protein
MPAAGPRGLEALLVRTDEPGRHPLVLLSHGSPRVAAERPAMSPNQPLPEAIEFSRRGSDKGRKAFEEFLAGAPHKAFAMSPKGEWGRRFGQRTIDAARSGALANCPASAGACRVIVVDDAAVPRGAEIFSYVSGYRHA